MKNRAKYIWIGILSLSLLSGLTGMASAEILISVSPSTQNVADGETFMINVTIDPDTSIAGVQFDLCFDASLISADSVTEGDLLKQGANTYFSPGTIDNTTGVITGVAGAITTPGATVSSAGVLATIRMTAKTVRGASSLDLSDVIVGDINGTPVSTIVNNGSVIIGVLCGDPNGDDQITTADAVIALGIACSGFASCDAATLAAADVSGDGKVTSLDALMIMQVAGSAI
jgi:hypothetical protein